MAAAPSSETDQLRVEHERLLGGRIARSVGGICEDVVAEMRSAHPARDIRCAMEGSLRTECDTDRIEQRAGFD